MKKNSSLLILSRSCFIIILILFILFSLFFLFLPQMDIKISHLFFQTDHFILKKQYIKWHLNYFRFFFEWFTWAFLTVLALLLILGIFFEKIQNYVNIKVCLFLLICFSLVPGLIVNEILKSHWGRARPYQTVNFGGGKQFTPPWVISQECKRNCSFSSGETANVFCYLALLFVIRRKKWIFFGVTLFGVLMVIERVAQGDHFFSDALISFFLDYLFIWIFYHLLFSPKENAYLIPAGKKLLYHEGH